MRWVVDIAAAVLFVAVIGLAVVHDIRRDEKKRREEDK